MVVQHMWLRDMILQEIMKVNIGKMFLRNAKECLSLFIQINKRKIFYERCSSKIIVDNEGMAIRMTIS